MIFSPLKGFLSVQFSIQTACAFQMFAALSVMTACTMAIPIFVNGAPRGQVSESSETYVSIKKLLYMRYSLATVKSEENVYLLHAINSDV